MENRDEAYRRCRQETVALPARASFAGQGRGGTDAGGQEADTDVGGRLQQPKPVGEIGAPAGLSENQRKNHRPTGRVQ